MKRKPPASVLLTAGLVVALMPAVTPSGFLSEDKTTHDLILAGIMFVVFVAIVGGWMLFAKEAPEDDE